MKIFYLDSEDEKITLSDDEDFKEALRYKNHKGIDILEVNIIK